MLNKITPNQIKSFVASNARLECLLHILELEGNYDLVSLQYVTNAQVSRVKVEGFQLLLFNRGNVIEVLFDTEPQSIPINDENLKLITTSQLSLYEQDDEAEDIYSYHPEGEIIINAFNGEVRVLYLEKSEAHEALISLLTN